MNNKETIKIKRDNELEKKQPISGGDLVEWREMAERYRMKHYPMATTQKRPNTNIFTLP